MLYLSNYLVLYIYQILMTILKGRGTSIKSTVIQFFPFSGRYTLYTMVNIKKGKIHSDQNLRLQLS